MNRASHYLARDGEVTELPRDRARHATAERRQVEQARALAARHHPLERFTTDARVEITAPVGAHRPFAGRCGRVVLVAPSGSAWVRVEKPQGHVADHLFAPSECSAEVGNG